MPSAGRMRGRVYFQERVQQSDGAGNTVAEFVTRFDERCEFIPLQGSEAVMQDRLGGIQPYIVQVHQSDRTRSVTTAWRLEDAQRPGRILAIAAPGKDPDQRGQWLDFLVREGIRS